MNNPTTRNQSPLVGPANVLKVPRTSSLVWRRTRIRRRVAVNPTRRTQAALAVLAVAIVGCSQASEGGTGGAGPTPLPPVEFTGRIICGPPVSPDRGGDSETLDVGDEGMVLTRYRGGAWRQTVTMTDPRLEGTVYQTWESDTYAMQGAEEGTSVWASTHRIENEAGAWEGRGYGGNFSDGTAIGDDGGNDSVWIGGGAYAGLTAIMKTTPFEAGCGFDVRGIVFQGAPVPEPYISR